jgi:hypothetical protein
MGPFHWPHESFHPQKSSWTTKQNDSANLCCPLPSAGTVSSGTVTVAGLWTIDELKAWSHQDIGNPQSASSRGQNPESSIQCHSSSRPTSHTAPLHSDGRRIAASCYILALIRSRHSLPFCQLSPRQYLETFRVIHEHEILLNVASNQETQLTARMWQWPPDKAIHLPITFHTTLELLHKYMME